MWEPSFGISVSENNSLGGDMVPYFFSFAPFLWGGLQQLQPCELGDGGIRRRLGQGGRRAMRLGDSGVDCCYLVHGNERIWGLYVATGERDGEQWRHVGEEEGIKKWGTKTCFARLKTFPPNQLVPRQKNFAARCIPRVRTLRVTNPSLCVDFLECPHS